jgi:hypothetical protein
MADFKVFELLEMEKILALKPGRAKNWTNGRTGVLIEPSVRKASGTGSRNLYSLQDLYLMGIAKEFSKAGFAAKAIGKLMEAARQMLEETDRNSVWTVYRLKSGGPYHIEKGRSRPENENVMLWHTFEIGSLFREIDSAVGKL